MSVVKKNLEDNFIYFIKELHRIEEELKILPRGSISLKKINTKVYYYHQWRDGRKVRSLSLGSNVPPDLIQGIKRRKLLEDQRKEILDDLLTIRKAVDIKRVTADEIMRILFQNGIQAIVVGSFCMQIMKDQMGYHLPTIKTQDIDFLIKTPYRGPSIDVEMLLSEIGFSRGFYPDGSTFFSNGIFKIEFLTVEKGRGTDKAIVIKSLHISATPLRFIQMLFDDPIKIEKDNYSCIIPSPWVFAFHKMLISNRRKEKWKKDKDELQATAVLREISKRPEKIKSMLSYLQTLPKKWVKRIKEKILSRDEMLFRKMFEE